MSRIEEKLELLGEKLPAPKNAVANYLGCKQSGTTLYASGRVSVTRGELGTDLTVAEGQAAAKEAMLDILAIVKAEIGDLDKIIGIDKMNGFVRSGPSFIEQPKVIDGASDLLVSLLGDAGRHARTATGVAQLPYGAAVQLELTLLLNGDRL